MTLTAYVFCFNVFSPCDMDCLDEQEEESAQEKHWSRFGC